MKSLYKILMDRCGMDDIGYSAVVDILGREAVIEGSEEFAEQFKPKWIPLTEDSIEDIPPLIYVIVWCPSLKMWFSAYRRFDEWVCHELDRTGEFVRYPEFTHYMLQSSIPPP
jgi:hypothetical protein